LINTTSSSGTCFQTGVPRHQKGWLLTDESTDTNARVLSLIGDIEFGGVQETSRRLDIAESTVKTYLGRIFTRTDTRRQADLVKLVAAFSSPVRG